MDRNKNTDGQIDRRIDRYKNSRIGGGWIDRLKKVDNCIEI